MDKYYKKFKERYNNDPVFRKNVNDRMNRNYMNRYNTDPVFRDKEIARVGKMNKKNKSWVKAYRKKRLGKPETIKELCKIYGFSDDVAEAIALDGEKLDAKLKISEVKDEKTIE